jgi:hypothetical protein
MKCRWIARSAFFMLVACGSGYADKVTVDWDRQANFGQYKTYAWTDSRNPAEDQLMAMRIMQAVDGQLRLKGLQKVEIGQNPDLSVEYDAGVSQKVDWVPDWWGPGYAWGPGWGWSGWGPGGGPGWASYYGWGAWGGPNGYYPIVQDIGSIAVNITDQNRNQLVWRGVASDALKDNPEKNAKKICELVAKMFRKYPPQSGCCRRDVSRTRIPGPPKESERVALADQGDLEDAYSGHKAQPEMEQDGTRSFQISGITAGAVTVKLW